MFLLSLFLSIDPHLLRVGDKLQTETVRAPSNSFSIMLSQSTFCPTVLTWCYMLWVGLGMAGDECIFCLVSRGRLAGITNCVGAGFKKHYPRIVTAVFLELK